MRVERKAQVGNVTVQVIEHHDQRDGSYKTVEIGSSTPVTQIPAAEWRELVAFVDEELAR